MILQDSKPIAFPDLISMALKPAILTTAKSNYIKCPIVKGKTYGKT